MIDQTLKPCVPRWSHGQVVWRFWASLTSLLLLAETEATPYNANDDSHWMFAQVILHFSPAAVRRGGDDEAAGHPGQIGGSR